MSGNVESTPGRRHLHVACAIIEHGEMILAAQRSAQMSLPLKWEFPGGKIEPGESVEECLCRELQEELEIQVEIGKRLALTTHHYSTFSVTLHPFICTIAAGNLVLHEHAAIAWVGRDELAGLDWAEADLPVIEAYLKL